MPRPVTKVKNSIWRSIVCAIALTPCSSLADEPQEFCHWARMLSQQSCSARYACVDDSQMKELRRLTCACLSGSRETPIGQADMTDLRTLKKFACCYGIAISRNPNLCRK
jgi:hypothetical protein